MKSSHKVIPAFQLQQAPTTWQPEELDVLNSEHPSEDLGAILEIFRPLVADEPEEHRNDLSARALPWDPGDLEEIFVYEAPAAMFVETVPDAVEAPKPIPQDQMAEYEKAAETILEQARAQENEILMQARQAAEKILDDARQEIEAARQAAYQKGLEDARAETQTHIQAAQTVYSEVNAWKEDVFGQIHPMVIAMVKEIAQKMFGEGVALNDQALQHNLNRVLTNVKSLGDINIYLNPRDAATIDSAWREMRSQISGSRVQIIPSETITQGGCFVEGQMGSVDARVETQLQVVLDTLSAVEEEPPMEEVLAAVEEM